MRTVLLDRRTIIALAGVLALAVVIAAATPRRADGPSRSPDRTAASAEAAVARLAAVPDPVQQVTQDLRVALADARDALRDTTSRRGSALRESRTALQRLRVQLLALEDGASDEQRSAIGAVNRELQLLLLELDSAR